MQTDQTCSFSYRYVLHGSVVAVGFMKFDQGRRFITLGVSIFLISWIGDSTTDEGDLLAMNAWLFNHIVRIINHTAWFLNRITWVLNVWS
jgi:hypothetical protein